MRLRRLRPAACLVAAAVLLPVLAAPPALADPTNTTVVSASTTVSSVRLTPGRIWWVDGGVLHERDADTTSSPATVSGADTTRQVGTVTVGTTTTPVYSPSADRLAYLDPASAVIRVVDSSTGGAVTAVPEPSGLTGIKLSGSRLEMDTATAVLVRDLTSGQQLTFPPSATLSGRYVAYFNADGSITRQDLLSGLRRQVRAPGGPSVCTLSTTPCTPANSPVTVKMRGDWMFWRFSCEVRGVNLATGAATLDLSRPAPCLKKFSLLEGWLVYKDTTGLQAQDLTATAASPLTLVSGAVSGSAVEDRSLAWYDATGLRIGAVPLPPSYAPTTRLADAVAPTAFSPNGDGRLDTWQPRFATSTNVSWSLAFTAASGAATGTPLTGTSRYGAITPTWSPGADVPDGTYTWTLTGTAVNGGEALKGTDGQGAGLTGTVVVRRTGLTGTVTAPLVTSALRTNLSLPITLTATGASGLPGYGPTSYTVELNDNGTVRTFSTASRTPAVTGAQGHTYRVRVRVTDNAGNTGPYSAPVTTAVPLDDRNPALAAAGSWSAVSSAGSFLGTVRSSRLAGSSLTLRTTLSRLAVVTTACATCGQLRVYVDGRYLTVFDTYSARTVLRKTVLLRTVATTAGLHTVRLVVVGTAGRPTVRLDAVAGIR